MNNAASLQYKNEEFEKHFRSISKAAIYNKLKEKQIEDDGNNDKIRTFT
jgi:hypothetical protein